MDNSENLENVVEPVTLPSAECPDNQISTVELKRCKEESKQFEKQLYKLKAKETPYLKQFVSTLLGHMDTFKTEVCFRKDVSVSIICGAL